MNSSIKKLDNYPATVMGAVYKEGTNLTLNDILQETVKEYDVLKTYNGKFKTSEVAINRTKEIGDYWLYDGNSRLNIDGEVVDPNSYIYVTQDYFKGELVNVLKSIHIPYQTNIKQQKCYDIVIVGGGAGGIGCAYALKDSGLRIALIEKLDTLGGTHCNAGVGLLIASPVGDWYKNICKQAYGEGMLDFRANNTYTYKEVGDGTTFEKRWRGSLFTDVKSVINGYSGNHVNINDLWFSKKYFDDLIDKIDIFLNTKVVNVKSDSQKIYEIECLNTITGKKFPLIGNYFVDCSADAVLFTCNANLVPGKDYYSGTDGRERFNETAYPEKENPDEYAINTVEPVFYSVANTSSDGYISPDAPRYLKSFDVEYKANYDYIPAGADSSIKICSRSYGTHMSTERFLTRDDFWNYADGEARALYLNFKDFDINSARVARYGGICKMLAIRESYRVTCEKTVDQNYLMKQITPANLALEKIMALSSWYVDIHNQSYSCVSNICNGIPYEAMIPKCYTNVLVASRCYGSSHIGLSSVRLVKTMLDLGYSAGKAMIYAVKGQIDVREVDTSQVQADTGIMNIMEEIETYFYGDTVDYIEVVE